MTFAYKNTHSLVHYEWRVQTTGTIICDLDGTLCNNTHRQHLWQQNRAEFFRRAEFDEPNRDVFWLVNSMFPNATVCMATGRPAGNFLITQKWLHDTHVNYDCLLMRDQDDHRPDAMVKYDMLQMIRRACPPIKLAIDDRPEVVEMWRTNGVECLQADPITWVTDRAQYVDVGEQDSVKWLMAMGRQPGADPRYYSAADELEMLRARHAKA